MKSTLCPNLDWHHPSPFRDIVVATLPDSSFQKEIEDVLLELWVDEQYDFKKWKKRSDFTIYDSSIASWQYEKKSIEEKLKREEELFEKLCKKFEEQGEVAQEDTVEQEEDDVSEEENDAPAQQKASHKVCKESPRTIRERQKREIQLAKSIKSSMATSQQRLIEMKQEIEDLEKKIDAYSRYNYADFCYGNGIQKLIESYETTHDKEALIKGIDTVVQYRDMMRRRYVPIARCSGSVKGLCDHHHLPLSPLTYTNKGEVDSVRCPLYPRA